MRIAQVSPLYESVPPKLYGGTERIVSYLTEELVRQGHQVTLFASGDSVTKAKLVPGCESALRLGHCEDGLACHLVMLEEVFRRRHQFEIIHFHSDYLHFPLARRYRVPHILTLHGRLDLPDLVPLYREYPEMPLVSISDSQRSPLRWANWVRTVYHGLPMNLLSFHKDADDYLVFLGRISPEKRVDRAIEIARRTGREIRVAAKIDKSDRDYFKERIEPLFRLDHVRYLGEIGEDAKDELLGHAAALLFPIDWPEPFGLVQIEAMACGTPVIAFRNGSVPEIIEPGVSGFICESVDEAVEAVGRLGRLSRDRCRKEFEERFTVSRMASDYVKVYQQIVNIYDSHRRDHPDQRPALYSGHVATAGRAVESTKAR